MPVPIEASDNADDDGSAADAPLMFTGIQILEPRIFSYIPRGVFSHSTTDVYPQAIAQGEVVAAHVAAGMWHELSTIPRYLEVSLALMAARTCCGDRDNSSFFTPPRLSRRSWMT